jgi:transcriptional regulator with XRE-family HTH domain
MSATVIERQPEVDVVTQGVGGQPTGSREPADEKQQPKAEPKERYAKDLGDLPDRVLAARKVTGRKELAEALGISQSAVWRAEQDRIHPGEVEALAAGIAKVEARIQAGEFVKPEKQTQDNRIEAAVKLLTDARSDKKVSKSALIDSVLDVLAPKA